MKLLKTMLVALLALSMITLFMGSVSAEEEKITLTYMDWEGVEMNVAIAAALEDFKAEYPNVTLLQIPTPSTGYGTKLNEMIAANAAPDVFLAGNDWVITYGDTGVMLDLNPYITDEFKGEFYGNTFDSFNIDGVQYGLPGLINVYGYFYNKVYFDEAGLDYPTIDWTYDDMFSYAEALKNTNEGRYGLYNQNPIDVWAFDLYSVANGGTGFTDAYYPVTKVTADEVFMEGLALYSKYLASGAIADMYVDRGVFPSQFIAGQIPIMQYGQWNISTINSSAEAADLNWGLLPMPAGSAGISANCYDATGWAVSSGTDYPEEAVALCKYMVSAMYEQVLPDFPVAPAANIKASQAYYSTLEELGYGEQAAAVEAMVNVSKRTLIRFLQPWAADANAITNSDDTILSISEGMLDVTGMDVTAEINAMVEKINEVIAGE